MYHRFLSSAGATAAMYHRRYRTAIRRPYIDETPSAFSVAERIQIADAPPIVPAGPTSIALRIAGIVFSRRDIIEPPFTPEILAIVLALVIFMDDPPVAPAVVAPAVDALPGLAPAVVASAFDALPVLAPAVVASARLSLSPRVGLPPISRPLPRRTFSWASPPDPNRAPPSPTIPRFPSAPNVLSSLPETTSTSILRSFNQMTSSVSPTVIETSRVRRLCNSGCVVAICCILADAVLLLPTGVKDNPCGKKYSPREKDIVIKILKSAAIALLFVPGIISGLFGYFIEFSEKASTDSYSSLHVRLTEGVGMVIQIVSLVMSFLSIILPVFPGWVEQLPGAVFSMLFSASLLAFKFFSSENPMYELVEGGPDFLISPLMVLGRFAGKTRLRRVRDGWAVADSDIDAIV